MGCAFVLTALPRYALLYLNVVKSVAVYVADIYTAITLLAFQHFNGNIYDRVAKNSFIPFVYRKWIFTGCIIFSFLLLAYEAHKSRAVVRSRDISYAYTNVMANNYYSLRSYNHFCFFCQINNSKKKKDELAFFIFFTFKGWKRLLVADGPRQVVNALTLYALAEASNFSTSVYDYYEGNIFTAIMLLTMLFTVVVFAGSAILLIIAAFFYLPLICYVQGNLKEYCCHKIDKRISELVQKKKKQRLGKYAAIARAEAAGDFTHLMNKKGIIVGRKMVQPTLPQLDVNLMEDDHKIIKKNLDRGGSISSSTAHGGYYGGEKNVYGMKEGEEYGSTAQLLMNQGPAGSTLGHHYGQANSSLSSGTLNGNPSLPPTVHNSPDTYPMQVRGLQGMQEVMRSQGSMNSSAILAQMGPIGTTPDVVPKRVVGRSATTASGFDEGAEYDGSDGAGMGAHRGGMTRSPLGAQDAPEAYQHENGYYSNWGGNGQEGEQQQRQGMSNGNAYLYSDVGVDYPPPNQAHGLDGVEYPPPQMTHPDQLAPPADLSAYAPYHQEGSSTNLSAHANGDGQGQSRVQSFSEVYEAYYNDHDAYGGYDQEGHYDQEQYAQEGNHYGHGQEGAQHPQGYDGQAGYYPEQHGYGQDYTYANHQAQAGYGQEEVAAAHAGYDAATYPQPQASQGEAGYQGHMYDYQTR